MHIRHFIKLILLSVLVSEICFAQPPDVITLIQAKELGFEIEIEKNSKSECVDLKMLSPRIDPVNPEYEDIKVSLRMFKDENMLMAFSLKNRLKITGDNILNEHLACLAQDIYDEITLSIIYEPMKDIATELKCLNETSKDEQIKCSLPVVCHTNWQIDISNQINTQKSQ